MKDEMKEREAEREKIKVTESGVNHVIYIIQRFC